MNPEIKAQWDAALRSGEYQQTQGWLRTDEGYCCLGVLTDLAVKAGIGEWVEVRDDRFGFVARVDPSIGAPEMGVLPLAVQQWAGLHSDTPQVVNRGYRPPLTVLNDEYGDSFNDIADLIREQL